MQDKKETNNEQQVYDLLREITNNGNQTVDLHLLARSYRLNQCLADPTSFRHKAAKELLSNTMLNCNLLFKEKATKRHAFSQAVVEDHRATVNEMLVCMKNFKNVFDIRRVFKAKDCNGNSVLHHAVNAMNDTLIKEILEIDVDRKIYFSRNNKGLFSIALAFKNYKENRAILPLSIINQLYFSLENPFHRTIAAEKEVKMEPWLLEKPVWRHVLRMCAMRNSEGKINNIDLNLWDFVIQVLDSQLFVMGMNVTKKLIYEYSREYSDTPGKMLSQADGKRLAGLAGRTLNQAGTNNTLARNKKFMQLAQLGEVKYDLWFITTNDSISLLDLLKRDGTKLPENATMALVGEYIFYIPPQAECIGGRLCIKIKYDELKDEKARFDSVKNFIKSNMRPNQILSAPDNVVVDIIRLIPLVKIINDQEDVLDNRNASKHIRNIGMGFLRNGCEASVTNVSLESISQNNLGY